LTLDLARRVDDALDGRVPISFCGGADAWNFADLVADGLTPVTVCTDLLKPGGAARLAQYLENLGAAMSSAGAGSLDELVAKTSGGRGRRWNLARHAERVAQDTRYARRERPLVFKGSRALGPFDCIAAPCVEACPAQQDVPEYLRLVAQGRDGDALDAILLTNALPGVTGSICDRPCTERCVRNHYDAPVGIREVKRFAFEHGTAGPETRARPAGVAVAIVGAGPAGLSAARALALSGFAVEIFEAKRRAGGMAGGAVPRYRLDDAALRTDLERLSVLGVKIHFGVAVGRDVSLDELRTRFADVFLGTGAGKGRRLGIPGEDAEGVVDALDFLEGLRDGATSALGTRVLVVGGGNSALDAARSARRVAKGAEVTIVYRRTRGEMPAHPDELRDALAEGVRFRELLAPVRVVVGSGRVAGLACTPMTLGAPDASGRKVAIPAGGDEVVLPADTILVAIGQEAFAIPTSTAAEPRLLAGGDAVRGPSSIIEAVADGLAAASAIARRHGVVPAPSSPPARVTNVAALMAKKARLVRPEPVPELPVEARGGFAEVLRCLSPDAARREAGRCLACDEVCSLCVTVCPNRANQAYAVPPLTLELPSFVVEAGKAVPRGTTTLRVAQGLQIVNLGDACNECGNCVTFCPTSGAPHRDKPTFWVDAAGFAAAKGDAFRMTRGNGALAIEARVAGRPHRLERAGDIATYASESLRATFDASHWSLADVRVEGSPREGETLDLSTCALLITLLNAAPALPPGPAAAGPS
jgi:putative selenate reductase